MANVYTGTDHRHPQYATHTAWQSWSPSYDGITVGDGTAVARYTQIGRTVIADYTLTLGSTSAVGTPGTVSLPVTASTVAISINNNVVGGAWFESTAGAESVGVTRIETSTLMRPIPLKADTAFVTVTGISTTQPHTWTTGDVLHMRAIYEAA